MEQDKQNTITNSQEDFLNALSDANCQETATWLREIFQICNELITKLEQIYKDVHTDDNSLIKQRESMLETGEAGTFVNINKQIQTKKEEANKIKAILESIRVKEKNLVIQSIRLGSYHEASNKSIERIIEINRDGTIRIMLESEPLEETARTVTADFKVKNERETIQAKQNRDLKSRFSFKSKSEKVADGMANLIHGKIFWRMVRRYFLDLKEEIRQKRLLP